MKVPANRTEGFLKQPDAGIRAVLVYGPDVGLVRERTDRLARAVVPEADDPFRVADLPGDVVAAEPGRLVEEAGAISLLGGRRLVRIRDAGDRVAPAIQDMLQAATGDTLVLVDAGDLGPRSALRKLFESDPALAALPCFAEGGADIARLIREAVAEEGYRIAPEAVELMAASLGGDRLVVRQEIAKLLTYAGDQHDIGVDDVAACIGDSAATSFDDVILAAADGDAHALDRAYGRLIADGEEPVAILRVSQRHFARLHLAVAEVEGGASPDQVVEQMRPPLFFRTKPRVRRQIEQWNVARVQSALDTLMAAEADCKKTGLPPATVGHRALIRVAALARAGSRRTGGGRARGRA